MFNRINIAMWSGPRNLSTALMRSFANRKDILEVLDEPFYASYLKETKKKHPMFKEIINSQELDWKKVIENCLRKEGHGICYQKHMVQHMLPNFDREWMLNTINCFLIRKPEEVISSFLKKWPDAQFEDFGFNNQIDLFNFIKNKTGEAPIVIDASDLSNNPEKKLKKLCRNLKIDWDSNMLQWKPGLKPYDGVWATHWYPSVKSSTSFQKKTTKKNYSKPVLNFANQARKAYSDLVKYKI